MALEGTIKDFGLGDILQLIGIQRKTGVLTLDNEEDTVMVQFHNGSIVGVDTKTRSVESMLGSVLVRTGRITEAQLEEALAQQKRTLQRLGHVLIRVGFISEEDLVDALRVQSLQIVYRLFRWTSGKYRFQASESLEYDEQHFMPISAETILMEGARMIDEWPILQRKIRSDKMVFRKSAAAAGLELTVGSIIDNDIDFDFDFEAPAPASQQDVAKTGITLTQEEREILTLVDGRKTVEEIIDSASIGEFDTYHILAELLTRSLIEEVSRQAVADGLDRRTRLVRSLTRNGLTAAVFLGAFLGIWTVRGNPAAPWNLVRDDPASGRLQFYASQARLERIDKALQVFYLDAGDFPQSLGMLAQNRYLVARDLIDPWGRSYGYELTADGLRVFGSDAKGEANAELSLSQRFTQVQRMMHAAEASVPSGPQ